MSRKKNSQVVELEHLITGGAVNDVTVTAQKDARWDIATIVRQNFDVEMFLGGLEFEDKTPLPEMLHSAVYEGFVLAMNEFQQLLNALDGMPGLANYPEKYLPQTSGRRGVR